MPCIRHLPLVLGLLPGLLLAGCGGGGEENSTKLDAVASKAALTAGTPELALRLADATLAQHPADVHALIDRGVALTELGRLGEARDSLRKAVAGRPHDTTALLALGRVELPVDPAAAEADFQSVLQKDGRNAAALNDLGIARDLQGRHADAEAAYRSAMAAQPTMVAAEVNLALCLAMRGQGSDAVQLLRPLAEAPDATQKIKENFAAVLAMAGQREAAERILAANLAADEVGPAVDGLASARATGPMGQVSQTVAPAADMVVASAPVAPGPVASGPVASAPVTIAPAKAASVIGARATPILAASIAGGAVTNAPPAVESRADAPAVPDNETVVQLAALDSEDAAHVEWDRLSRRMPDLLNGRQPLFSHAERDGHIFWRVRTAGFADLAEARGFCAHVRNAGGGCTVLVSRLDTNGPNMAPPPVPVMAGPSGHNVS